MKATGVSALVVLSIGLVLTFWLLEGLGPMLLSAPAISETRHVLVFFLVVGWWGTIQPTVGAFEAAAPRRVSAQLGGALLAVAASVIALLKLVWSSDYWLTMASLGVCLLASSLTAISLGLEYAWIGALVATILGSFENFNLLIPSNPSYEGAMVIASGTIFFVAIAANRGKFDRVR